MRIATLLLPCLLATSACGQAQPVAEKERIADPEERGDALPVMGPERRIAVLATGILDGKGLSAGERYPALLESSLRARGVNARVVAVSSPADAAKAELLVAPALVTSSIPVFVPAMTVPPALVQKDGRHPIAQGVEELVAQSADQIARALPPLR